MRTILIIALVIVCISIIGLIMLQPSKSQGLSGLITGGSNENFFAKNKIKTKEKMMARATVVLTGIFIGLVIALGIIN